MVPESDISKKVEYFITTRADLLTKYVNDFIKALRNTYGDNVSVGEIKPFMSYTSIKDKGAYMIGAQVEYYIYEKEEANNEGL